MLQSHLLSNIRPIVYGGSPWCISALGSDVLHICSEKRKPRGERIKKSGNLCRLRNRYDRHPIYCDRTIRRYILQVITMLLPFLSCKSWVVANPLNSPIFELFFLSFFYFIILIFSLTHLNKNIFILNLLCPLFFATLLTLLSLNFFSLSSILLFLSFQLHI